MGVGDITGDKAGQIELMDGVTGDGAATVFAEVEPAAGGIVGQQGGRASPELIIKALGHGLIWPWFGKAVFHHVIHTHHVDVTQLTGADMVFYMLHIGRATRLHADLNHAFILARRSHHLHTLKEVVAHGLFHVYVLVGLAGHDRSQCVPVVGGGIDEDIYAFVVEDPAKVLDQFGGFALGLLNGLLCARQSAGIGVAEIGHFSIGPPCKRLGQIASTPAQPHGAYHDLVIGGSAFAGIQGRCHAGTECALDKVSAFDCIHRIVLNCLRLFGGQGPPYE